MEQFRQIGEVLGSLKALMVLEDDDYINKRQCCLLFDMFNSAFNILSEEIKRYMKLEERNTKWKPLEQPLKELHKALKEGEMYVRQCLDSKEFFVKALSFHNNHDCVEFHIHNLLCSFSMAIEAIETAGEISGLDLEEIKKKRIMLGNKYDQSWNDPKLFQWNFGKQYLVSLEICHKLQTAWKEDQWLLLEMMNKKKTDKLSKQEQRLYALFIKKLNGEKLLFPSLILTGAKDYQVRRRLVWGSQYKEIQWLGETFALRHFFGELPMLNSEISTLLSLSHPNVIRYLCGFHDEERSEFFLVMESMSKDLNSYIREVCGPKREIPFPLPVGVDIMLQIARGMEYLHSRKIYHGDLNPSNVILKPRSSNSSSTEGHFLAKVSGFGLGDVKVMSSRNPSPKLGESLPHIWYAPEVLAEQEMPSSSCVKRYSEKADVYSFGMLCFELLTGKVPFEDGHLQGEKMGRNIMVGERPLFPFALPKCLATVIKRCWQIDPNQRPSFSSICRIIRYIKRLFAMNPHLSQLEISPILQADFCELEAAFIKDFPAGTTVDLTTVSQIPFQLFSYRLAEKEKLHMGNRDQGSDSNSEITSSQIDEAVKMLEGSFSIARDMRSVCSEIISDKRNSLFRKYNGFMTDDHFLPTQDTMSLCSETPEERVLPRRSQNTKYSEIRPPQKKLSALTKCSTVPVIQHVSDTRSVCSETPPEKAPDNNMLLLSRSTSVKVTRDSVQQAQRTGPTMLTGRSRSMRMTTTNQMHQPMPRNPGRTKRN